MHPAPDQHDAAYPGSMKDAHDGVLLDPRAASSDAHLMHYVSARVVKSLVERRSEGIVLRDLPRGAGAVITDVDGTASSSVRMSIPEVVKAAFDAAADHLEREARESQEP